MESREFRYRPHVKWFQYAIVVFVALVSVLPNTITAIRTGLEGQMSVLALSLALVMGVMTLVLFWLFRTLASTRVSVTEDGLHYRNYRKDFTVGFDEITELKFPAIPYLGGWLKIVSDKPDIRLTVVFEDLDEFVELLKQHLDDANNTSSYDRDKFFGFYKTAGFSSRSWDRAYQWFIPLSAAAVAIGAGWLFGAPAVFDEMTFGAQAFAGLTTALPFLGWMVAEGFLLVSLARGADKESFSLPERNRSRERRYMLIGYALATVLTLPTLFIA